MLSLGQGLGEIGVAGAESIFHTFSAVYSTNFAQLISRGTKPNLKLGGKTLYKCVGACVYYLCQLT